MSLMNQEEISNLIGVRPPYLWISEVQQANDQHLVATKFLSPELELFQGHFVGCPVFPGALQCEACFQAASALIARIQSATPGHVPVIARVNQVKFRRLVRPGDTIRVDVRIVDQIPKVFRMRGRVSVDNHLTAELEFYATEAPLPN